MELKKIFRENWKAIGVVLLIIIVMLAVIKIPVAFAAVEESPVKMVAKVEGILTGIATMDEDNEPGNDESAENDVVRSFDTVLYPLSINVSSTDGKTYKSIKMKVSASVKNGVSADGRFVNAVFDSFWNGTFDLDIQKSVMEKEVSIVSTGAYAEYNIPLNIQGASHGTKIETEFTVELLSAIDEDGNEINLKELGELGEIINDPIIIPTKEISISSKVNLSAKFAKSNSDLSVDFDKYTDTTGNPEGLIKFHGIAISIEPVNNRKNMIGSAYPTNNVEVKLKSIIERTDNNTGVKSELNFVSETRPITIFDYGTNPNKVETEEHLHSATYDGHLLAYDGITSLPASRRNLSSTQAGAVTDSGIIKMVNELDNTITLSFKDFIVTNHAPTSVINSSSSTFNVNLEKIFLVARFSDVIPLEGLLPETTLDISLIVNELKYEENSTVKIKPENITLKWQEVKFGGPGIVGINQSYISSNKSTNLGGGSNTATGTGTALAVTGQKIYSHSYFSVSAGSFKKAVGLQKWNPNESEYDSSRTTEVTSPYFLSTSARGSGIVAYGVSKDNDYSLVALNAKTTDSYNWYTTVTLAEAAGKISAVKFEVEAGAGIASIDEEFYSDYKFIVPKKVIGNVGTITESTPHITLAYMKITWLDGTTSEAGSNGSNSYVPTTYKANGEVDTFHIPKGTYGDTLVIMPYSVRISKTSDKKNYLVNDTVIWTVTPTMEANEETGNQTIIVTDTLAKGSVYEIGSAKYNGERLDPIVTKNEVTGITTLTWTINNVTNANLKTITYNTTFNQRNMTFNSNGQSSLTDKIIIESPGSKTLPEFRTYSYSYSVTRSLEYGVFKAVDKNLVELNEEFTYTIGVYNNTNLKINNITGIDILPKNGYMTTEKDGIFNLKSIITTDTDMEIYFTSEDIPENTDPNSVNTLDWILYTGQIDIEITAIFFKRPDLNANQEEIIEVTIQPINNKIDNIYQNQVFANSSKNSKIISNIVKTTVAGREIEGIVWEDSNKNGLMDASETLLENVEVFLYRKVGTNLELVIENIQGVKFVENNISNIKTDVDGKYSFVGLAAGKYIVGFRMPEGTESQEYVVTEFEATSEEEKTSKATMGKAGGINYLTMEYNLPELSEMSGTKYSISYINAGITLADRKFDLVIDKEETIENPKTWDSILVYIGIGIIGLVGLGYAIKLRKKKN